jgi:hypothetical protein
VAERRNAGTWKLGRAGALEELACSTYPGTLRVDAAVLAAAPGPEVTFAPGIRWAKAASLEVRALDPVGSALLVPLFPLLILGAALDDDGVDDAMGSSPSESWFPTIQTWTAPARDRPLFTFSARRRHIVRALATADGSASYRGDFTAGASVGARFGDFFEIAAVVRRLSVAQASVDGTRAGVTAGGLAMGLHVDGDANPRFAFYLGAEVVGREGAVAGTFKWGPRFGLGPSLFAGVYPLGFSLLEVSRHDGSELRASRVVSQIEVGGAF